MRAESWHRGGAGSHDGGAQLPIALDQPWTGPAEVGLADRMDAVVLHCRHLGPVRAPAHLVGAVVLDRKSTRLNSGHPSISYAVFCLKKKKNNLDRLFS